MNKTQGEDVKNVDILSVIKKTILKIIRYTWRVRGILKKNILEKTLFCISIVHNPYKIEGCGNRLQNWEYVKREKEPNFQEKIELFKQIVQQRENVKSATTFFKFGDGDYYFLKGVQKGSAKPGVRALGRELSSEELEYFNLRAQECNFYSCEILDSNRRMFREVFPKKIIDFPAEANYGLVANHWFTSYFSGRIGLIGASEKLKLIKELMKNEIYRDYLGLDYFNDYIEIPQKFACDEILKTEELIANQLKSSKSSIFLVGIGHAKSGILANLTKYKKAVYVDIGSGIDALAGIVDERRPYFSQWKNFRLKKGFNYGSLDFLQYESSSIIEI
jgi:hypothetical protein